MADKLHIVHVFPSFEIGGAQRRTVSLLNAGLRDFKHSIIALDGNYNAQSLLIPDPKHIKFIKDIKSPKGQTLKASLSARKHLRALKPDLLVTYNWGSIEWNLANMVKPICPMLHIQDGFASDEQLSEIRRRTAMRRRVYSKCANVIVPSKSLHHIACKSWRIALTRVSYIPNGIDISRFQSEADPEILQNLGIDEEHFIIGTVAALRPEKNLTALINGFKVFLNNHSNRDCTLVIVGDGGERQALQHYVENEGIASHVIFTGNIENPEKILPAFDVFALTSHTEQMPIAIIEAMATGLPVIAADVGDVRHMLSGENSALITGVLPAAIARCFKLIQNNPDMARDIGALNQKKAQQDFAFEQMLAGYTSCIEKAVKSKETAQHRKTNNA